MRTVLVANRGEIARRIIRACREEGLRSVAVFSDADAGAPHVSEADDAVHLGPTPAAESYLDADRVIAAARASGADAVHPGYGFLSENAAFARAVREAGLVLVGPTPEVIELMGRKDRAREVAERAGVPVTGRYPVGAEGASVPADAYPVLVKAAAGGGGKGMHVVRSAAELAPAVARARREAASAFGDDTLLVETYVEGGRHVEVQVFGDVHGDVVHLFDRDCSVQRRHQKVVEEAPAPHLSETVRSLLHDSSVALCREVGYTGAGTVEFLVGPGPDGEQTAFFLEMNTRLQVEHCVTEEVTGADLVRWQLAVAAGERLPRTQDQITVSGHAVEVRVYAEDPYAGFLPQGGRIEHVQWPDGARVESAVDGPGEVTTAYDPMLAKIVAHGPDRAAAVEALAAHLADTAVLGVTTNLGFLRRVLLNETFGSGGVHTGWLDGDEAADLMTSPELPETARRLAAAALLPGVVTPDGSPFGTADGWRAGGAAEPAALTLVDAAGRFQRATSVPAEHPGIVRTDARGAWVAVDGQSWRLDLPDDVTGPSALTTVGDGGVTAPMPGTIVEVLVAAGEAVSAGQRLATMEAMKMELSLDAPHDGVVASVQGAPGDQVAMGHVVVRVDPEAS